MKTLLTVKKTALSLALAASIAGVAWAQSENKPAAEPKTAVVNNEAKADVLNAEETNEFLVEMLEDLAADGYKVTFGDTVPTITIKTPDTTPKPLSAEETAAFWDDLQKSLEKVGIEIDFGDELPQVERLPVSDFIKCDDDLLDFADFEPKRYADDEDEELLEALIEKFESRHGGKKDLRLGDDVTELLLMLLLEKYDR